MVANWSSPSRRHVLASSAAGAVSLLPPRVYGFSTLGNPLQLFALTSVFVLATSFMGQAVGAWFKRPETPSLIFLGNLQLPSQSKQFLKSACRRLRLPSLIAGR